MRLRFGLIIFVFGLLGYVVTPAAFPPEGAAFAGPVITDGPDAETQTHLRLTPTPTRTPDPAATVTAAPTAEELPLGVVSGDLVNLRGGPGTDFEIVGRVVLSDTLPIIGRLADRSWWQVCCRPGTDEPAWITAEFVEVSPSSAQTTDLVPVVKTAPPAFAALLAEAGARPHAEEGAAPAAAQLSATASSALPPPGNFGPPGDANPLTGLPLSPEQRGQRPLIVCINNDPQARPQFGLSNADVVYEYSMEGFYITRFSGLFYGQPAAQIGPVRSARLVNFYLGLLYNAPLVCSGASDQVRFTLKNEAPFPYLDIDLDDRSNNLYSVSVGQDYRTRVRTKTAWLRQWLADWGEEGAANVRGFTFGPLPDGGVPAQTIKIPYTRATGSQVEYRYDPASQRYLRFQGDAPHLDGNTGVQLSLDNVIVQYAPHEETDIVEDSLGSKSIRINLFGSNRAILFRDGLAFAGRWQSLTRGDLPRFFDQSGREIPLKPGQTWISIVPEHYVIEYTPEISKP